MTTKIKILIIFTCFLCVNILGVSFSSVIAATVYVDYANGSNSNTGNSTTSPWKHCPGDSSASGNAASFTPSPGDTICFKGGVNYSSGKTISLKSSGTNGNHIVYNGNCTDFGNGKKAILNKNTNFYIRSRDYTTIKNFEFTGFTSDVIWQDYQQYPDDAIGTVVDSNYIHDGSIPQYGAVSFWNSQNTTLSNNTFYNVNYSTHAGGRGPTYFQCRFDGKGSCVSDSTGLTVTGNTFSYNGNTPVFCFGQNNLTISYNTILGPNYDQHSQMITHYNAIAGNAEIYGNYINTERAGASFESIHPTGTGLNIYNNIIDSNDNVGWNLTSWGPGSSGIVRIINNTLLHTSSSESVGFATDTYNMVIFKNNIADGRLSAGGPYSTSSNCYTYTGSGSETGAVYETNLNNIFFDYAKGDYRLKPGSPAIGAGADVSVYGLPVRPPKAIGWNMGAYQLTEKIELVPPSNLHVVAQ